MSEKDQRTQELLKEWDDKVYGDEFCQIVGTVLDDLYGSTPNSDLGDEIGEAVKEAALALEHARYLRQAELSYALWRDVEEGRL